MAESARNRMIAAATDLFYRVGFHAVGLDAILAAAGVTKTTFYNHFPSKDDLVVEVLRGHDRWWRDTFRERVRALGGDSARGQLLAISDVLREMFQEESFNGCFFVNVAVQFPLPHDPAHLAAAEHKRAMHALLRELAAYANAADPDALAEELELLMEGAYVTMQVTRRPETAEVAQRMLHRIVAEHLPNT
jgi:AcrR family transcriptional regulator